MELTLSGLLSQAIYTLRNPRDGVRQILSLNPSMQVRWLAFLIMAIGSAIVTHLSFAFVPEADRDAVMHVMDSPLRTAALQGVLLLAIVQLVWWLGRLCRGTGTFPDALLGLVWLQFIMLSVQVVQLLLMLVSPPLAAIANLAGFVLFIWLLTNFVAELHGFRSLVVVLVGIVFGALLLAFGLAILLLILTGGRVA